MRNLFTGIMTAVILAKCIRAAEVSMQNLSRSKFPRLNLTAPFSIIPFPFSPKPLFSIVPFRLHQSLRSLSLQFCLPRLFLWLFIHPFYLPLSHPASIFHKHDSATSNNNNTINNFTISLHLHILFTFLLQLMMFYCCEQSFCRFDRLLL